MDEKLPPDAALTAAVIRFTPFTLDVRAAELRKHGTRLRLPGQSFQVLRLLLEHPGEVVLREEIRDKLWPNGTIVEFDHSINAAIKQLRGALGDSAEEPRYIQTVGRQGYRFIGQLDAVEAAQLETPLAPKAAPADAAAEMVSHFRLLRKLGEGAMGKVCLAEDLKLGRQVALKFLADDAAMPALVERFRREARAAAVLSHPNICAVYGVEEYEGQPVIVMEFVEGETLAARLERGALKPEQALALAIQIAAALAEAHGKGVVHRDLKPANIMLGRILGKPGAKVLDFGLAKMERAVHEAAQTNTMTAEGTLLGTVQYMSPEQAQGKEADARSDIFSFGLVLYEMLTGKRAFAGSNPASIIAAILEREAPTLEPAGMNRVVQACLAKDPADRFQTARDLRRALEWGGGEGPPAAAPVRRARRIPAAVWLAVPVLVAAGWFYVRHGAPQAPVLVQLTAYTGFERFPSFSPDGTQVAFTWDSEKEDNSDIYVKLVGESNAVRLTTDAAPDLLPAWSPDGKRIAFQRNRPEAPGIWSVSPLGGAEQKLADVRAVGQMSWSPDGKWLAAMLAQPGSGAGNRGELFVVPAGGGEPRRITGAPRAGFGVDAGYSPDGRQLAYSWCTSLWSCDLYVQALDGGSVGIGEARRITRQGVFIRGLAWSRDGAGLVYSGSVSWGLTPWLWRVGTGGTQQPERLDFAGQKAIYPAISAAGGRLAFSRITTDFDVWRYAVGGSAEPFLKSSVHDLAAQYSPDGSRIVFGSDRSGEVSEIWLANADGSQPVQLTKDVGRGQGSPRWSPDGRLIAFDSLNVEGESQVYVVEAAGGRPRRLSTGGASDAVPSWSHDGKSVYFYSDRTGRNEVWRVPVGGGAAQQITDTGAGVCLESTDGRRLYYQRGRAIFERATGGGAERQVVEDVTGGHFAVVEDGLYWIGRADAENLHPIRFYESSTGAIRVLGKVEGPLEAGFSVSPDRKHILFGKSATAGMDLMMIEHFR